MKKNNFNEKFKFSIIQSQFSGNNSVQFIINAVENPILQGIDGILAIDLGGFFEGIVFEKVFIPNSSYKFIIKDLTYEKWINNLKSISQDEFHNHNSYTERLISEIKKKIKTLEG